MFGTNQTAVDSTEHRYEPSLETTPRRFQSRLHIESIDRRSSRWFTKNQRKIRHAKREIGPVRLEVQFAQAICYTLIVSVILYSSLLGVSSSGLPMREKSFWGKGSNGQKRGPLIMRFALEERHFGTKSGYFNRIE